MPRDAFANHTRGLLTLGCALLSVVAPCCLGEEIEFTFQNAFDNTTQQAAAFVPDVCKTREKNPLLVVAHYLGGTRHTAKREGYYPECEARGWLLVCPELHGHRTEGATSFAALEAQHDIVGSINYMKQKFRVDPSRIYLAGRSMGGMLAELLAAKYPDLFAAVVAGQGISNLQLWTQTTLLNLKASAEKECGPFSEVTRFDYQRRSPISYAPNFQYVPLILWHGTNDTWVPPAQSEQLLAAIRRFNRFQADVHWLQCAPHCAVNFPPRWICDRIQYYQNLSESGSGTPSRFFPELNIVTDESKQFFWLHITLARPEAFTRVHANLNDDVIAIRSDNAQALAVDLDHVSRLVKFSKFDIRSDTNVTFTIMKGGKTRFTANVEHAKAAPLPAHLFEN